jgi:hypothetical protein
MAFCHVGGVRRRDLTVQLDPHRGDRYPVFLGDLAH